MGAPEDILEWSNTKLAPWRQDALRRLAGAAALTPQDHQYLLNLIKEKVGFAVSPKPAAPIPLAKEHITGAGSGVPINVKSIRNVTNVNRLVPSAGLTFKAGGLTVVYGRNGSGKSGFVRILRTACRTRCENPQKLKVLTDVYGSGGGPQGAEIVIDTPAGEVVIPWTTGAPATEHLQQVAVFDSSAAQLYVDGGNQVQFLPFGLALPYKLNELCLSLKAALEAERKPVTEQSAALRLSFDAARATKAQTFCNLLAGSTTDAQIDTAATFSGADQTRLEEVNRLLAASTATSADLTAFATWLRNLAAESEILTAAFSDPKIEEYAALKRQASEARATANADASVLFADEPLRGVGSETWRRLWVAARNYSVAESYPGRDFPVVGTPTDEANCVLCQQPLGDEASNRLSRFQAYVAGELAAAADEAEANVEATLAALPAADLYIAKDWPTRLEQIRKRKPELADALAAFKSAAEVRRSCAVAKLQGVEAAVPAAAAVSPRADFDALVADVEKEALALANADGAAQRQVLQAEQWELADRKILSANRDQLVKRRDLLKKDGLYAAALAEVQTGEITKKANALLDTHLNQAVMDQYNAERAVLEISHLKIGLSRKSDPTKAIFQTTSGTSLTKVTSEILSEGEQRALALAAFLTEVAVTAGSGPIVVDDPVSSLDRDRGKKVAERIAAEALKRQVIVFTHDLIFFNDLCDQADRAGVPNDTIALFADKVNAGKIDPAGILWKGLNVKRRLGQLKQMFAPLGKLHQTSPAQYEIDVKNLYGRLRDAYERLVEEYIFCDVVRRGVDRVETQMLRRVHLSDELAVMFYDGMAKANTLSHDNPAADTVQAPDPAEVQKDLEHIETLMEKLRTESDATEAKRPSMKKK
jgi:energy-coupling factor transporter ATP-binding protein EcfA2